MIRWLLLQLVRFLAPPRVIMDRDGATPFFARWYLVGRQPGAVDRNGNLLAEPERSAQLHLYLHRFFRSDHDGELHSHPWRWAVALILAGGYREERRVGDRVVTIDRKPGSLVFLRGEDFHRVDLLGAESWSLFLVGPRVATWFFWDRVTKRRAPWRSFLMGEAARDGAVDWVPDVREPPSPGEEVPRG